MGNHSTLRKRLFSFLEKRDKCKEKEVSKKVQCFTAFTSLSHALVRFQMIMQVITQNLHRHLFASLTDLRKSKLKSVMEGDGKRGVEVLFLDFLAGLTNTITASGRVSTIVWHYSHIWLLRTNWTRKKYTFVKCSSTALLIWHPFFNSWVPNSCIQPRKLFLLFVFFFSFLKAYHSFILMRFPPFPPQKEVY